MNPASAASAPIKSQPNHPASPSASRPPGQTKGAGTGEAPSFAQLLTAADETSEAESPNAPDNNLPSESDKHTTQPRKRRTGNEAATDNALGTTIAQAAETPTEGDATVSPLLQGLMDWRGYQTPTTTSPPATGNAMGAGMALGMLGGAKSASQIIVAASPAEATPTELLFPLPAPADQSSTAASMTAAAGNGSAHNTTNVQPALATRNKALAGRTGLAATNALQAAAGSPTTLSTADLAAAQQADTAQADARGSDPRSLRSTVDLARSANGTVSSEINFSTDTPSALTAARTDAWIAPANPTTDPSLALGATTGPEGLQELTPETTPSAPLPEGLAEALEQTGAEIAYWSARGAHKASLTVGGDGGAPLEVKVSMAGGQVQVEFLTAEGPMREALTRHAQQMLHGLLQTQGIELTAVSVGAHSAGHGQPAPDQHSQTTSTASPPSRPAALSAQRTTSDHWQPASRPHTVSAHKLDLFA